MRQSKYLPVRLALFLSLASRRFLLLFLFSLSLSLSLSLFPSLRENVTSRPSSALLSPRSYFILLPNQTVVNFVLRIFQIFLELESNFVSFVQRQGKFLLLLLLLFIYRSEE